MADWKMKIYSRMPSVIRDILASVRGLELRRWRYGPETE